MNFTDVPQLDLSGEGSAEEIRKSVRHPIVYLSAKRQMQKYDRETAAARLAAGLESYTFAIQDLETGRWIAGVMENIAPRRFKRRVSLPLFTTAEEATDAAERLIRDLNRRS